MAVFDVDDEVRPCRAVGTVAPVIYSVANCLVSAPENRPKTKETKPVLPVAAV